MQIAGAVSGWQHRVRQRCGDGTESLSHESSRMQVRPSRDPWSMAVARARARGARRHAGTRAHLCAIRPMIS